MLNAKSKGKHSANAFVKGQGVNGICDLPAAGRRHLEYVAQFLAHDDGVRVNTSSANSGQDADSDMEGGRNKAGPAELALRTEARRALAAT
jgi:hypothetical protein